VCGWPGPAQLYASVKSLTVTLAHVQTKSPVAWEVVGSSCCMITNYPASSPVTNPRKKKRVVVNHSLRTLRYPEHPSGGGLKAIPNTLLGEA
jgi:hypothetical protein